MAHQIDRTRGYTGDTSIKLQCAIVTYSNIAKNGVVTIGSYTTADKDRVLQAVPGGHIDNGVWECNAEGTWTRAPDFNGTRDVVEGTIVPVLRSETGSESYSLLRVSSTENKIGDDPISFALEHDGLNSHGFVFDSVASLRLNAIVETSMATTLGYYSPRDGGGSSYSLDSSDSTTADDGFLCIVDAGGRRWKLQIALFIDIRKAGASVNFLDNASFIQKCIDLAYASGGGTLFVPSGVFMSGRLRMKTGVTFIGVSIDHTGVLVHDSVGSCVRLKNGGNSPLVLVGLGQHSFRAFDITWDGNKAQQTEAHYVIEYESCLPSEFNSYAQDSNSTWERCAILNGSGGGANVTPTHRASHFVASYIGENDAGSGIRIETSDCVIDRCLLGLNMTSNIALVGAEMTHVIGCDIFHGDYSVSLSLGSYWGPNTAPCAGTIIVNCEMDGAHNHSLFINGQHRGTSVVNSRFKQNAVTSIGAGNHVYVGAGAIGTALVACQFTDPVPSVNYDIFVADAADIVAVSGNWHAGEFVTGRTNRPECLRAYGSNPAYFIDDAGRAVLSRVVASGYSTLGASSPAIQMKELSGTSAAAAGGAVSIAHGLTQAKIIGVDVWLSNTGGSDIPPGYVAQAQRYGVYVTGTDVVVTLDSTATSVVFSRPLRILVTYKE